MYSLRSQQTADTKRENQMLATARPLTMASTFVVARGTESAMLRIESSFYRVAMDMPWEEREAMLDWLYEERPSYFQREYELHSGVGTAIMAGFAVVYPEVFLGWAKKYAAARLPTKL